MYDLKCYLCGKFISLEEITNKNKVTSFDRMDVVGQSIWDVGYPEYYTEFAHNVCIQKEKDKTY